MSGAWRVGLRALESTDKQISPKFCEWYATISVKIKNHQQKETLRFCSGNARVENSSLQKSGDTRIYLAHIILLQLGMFRYSPSLWALTVFSTLQRVLGRRFYTGLVMYNVHILHLRFLRS